MKHVSSSVLKDFEREIDAVVEAVRSGERTKGQVVLSYSVQTDEEGEMTGACTLKGASAIKRDWVPSTQPRLELDEGAA